MPTQFLKPLLLVFGLILPAWVIFRLLTRARKNNKGKAISLKKEIVLVLFTIYIGTVLTITIAPSSVSGFNNPPGPGLNFIPLINTYRQFISTLGGKDNINTDFALENIIGNIILFMPLGIFLPHLFPKINSIKKIALVCFFCSLSIELLQLMLRIYGTFRTVDIDDVILNTSGGSIGALVYYKLISRYFI